MTEERRQRISQSHQGRPKKKCEPGCTCGHHSVELRREQSERAKSRTYSEETKRKISEGLRNRPREYTLTTDGYLTLSGVQHPVAYEGYVLVHRQVLYDKIGPGPHYCHWNCGKLLEWATLDWNRKICADHLDGNKQNNDPENLVPSCDSCNVARARAGNPLIWSCSL